MAPTRSGEVTKRGRGRPPKNPGTSSFKKASQNQNKQQPSTAAKSKPRNRVARDKPNDAIAKPTKKTSTAPSKQKKKRAHDVGIDELGEAEPSAQPRKRKAKVVDNEEVGNVGAEGKTIKTYAHLTPKTKRIRQEVLQGWEDVSSGVLEQIRFLLKHAKDEVVYTRRDARRAEDANEILLSTIHRLERSLSHMKIPPNAKALHFNLDRLAERNEQVYGEVTTSRHSKLLLEEQVELAQSDIEEDQEKLKRLQKNAQDWRVRWRSQEKKQLHPLLRQSQDGKSFGDGADDINLKPSAPIDTLVIDSTDSDLTPLLEQLRRSLDAMQGNHEQMHGVSDAMRGAKAALDDVLFKHASARQYDAV